MLGPVGFTYKVWSDNLKLNTDVEHEDVRQSGFGL